MMLMLIADLRELFKLGLRSRRTWRFVFQHLWRGWSDADSWSLDYYVARKTAPVMKRYIEIASDQFLLEDGGFELAEALTSIEDFKDGEWDPENFQEKFSDKLIGFWW